MTTHRPVCLELCAGQGGATKGLMRAGYDVIAVDTNKGHLARNPARWKVFGDAFHAIETMGQDVDLLWASWPCQGYTAGLRANRSRGITNGHTRLIATGREAMQDTGTPWVIENVEGARSELREPIMLCGVSFGLSAIDDDGTPLVMLRHRLFEASEPLTAPSHPKHDRTAQVGGAYGGARRDKVEARSVRHGGYVPSAHVQATLLGVSGMTEQGQYLCIPPIYAQYVAEQMNPRMSR